MRDIQRERENERYTERERENERYTEREREKERYREREREREIYLSLPYSSEPLPLNMFLFDLSCMNIKFIETTV